MEELEKIEVIRDRLGVSYAAAKKALDDAEGDVVQALINLESEDGKWDSKVKENTHQLLKQIKEILEKGNVTRVKLKKDGETVFEIPATVGAVGLIGMIASTPLAIMGGLATVAGMLNNYTLEVEKKNGETETMKINLEKDSTKD